MVGGFTRNAVSSAEPGSFSSPATAPAEPEPKRASARAARPRCRHRRAHRRRDTRCRSSVVGSRGVGVAAHRIGWSRSAAPQRCGTVVVIGPTARRLDRTICTIYDERMTQATSDRHIRILAGQIRRAAPRRRNHENWRANAGTSVGVMAGQRVFMSGVGGELGTQVAGLLEDEPWVGALSGIDADPPRSRFKRTAFHRIHPDEHDRIVETVIDFDPHMLVHVGVWEPDARAGPALAAQLTDNAAISILGRRGGVPARSNTSSSAAASRSTARAAARSPDPTSSHRSGRPRSGVAPLPTSSARRRASPSVSASPSVPSDSRPCIGPHVPSPLGRFLRLPAVPFNALAIRRSP